MAVDPGPPTIDPPRHTLHQPTLPVDRGKFSVALAENPLGKLNLPLGRLDFALGKLDHPLGRLNFPLGKLDNPLGKLNFTVDTRENPLGKLDFPGRGGPVPA